MGFKNRLFLYFLVLAAFVPVMFMSTNALAGAKSDFEKGWKEFHYLKKTPSKAKYRSYWMRTKRFFLDAYRKNPNGPYAPKSLYYLGRTYHSLGKCSNLKKDFKKALQYYDKMIQNFSSHSWADDAKLYEAKIRLNHLYNKDQAYLDLLSIIHNYSEGDKKEEAQKLLKSLDNGIVKKIKTDNRKKIQQIAKTETDTSTKSSQSSLTGLHKLERIRHWNSNEYTRVVLDLSSKSGYNDFLLKPNSEQGTPYRLVVDLKETMVIPDVSETLKIRDGILEQIRSGQNRKNKARVVLEIQDLEDYRIFTLPDPYRIVVDIYAPEQKESIQERQKQARKKQKPIEVGDKRKKHSDSLVEQLGLNIEKVMIDPGHGGDDPGAVHNNIYEKDINLRLAKILGKILQDKGFEVAYTRKTDKSIPLEERTAIANSARADLFLSLHVNAHKVRRVRGFEVYYLNLAKDEESVRVAARENSVSTKKISDLQVILTDLMLNSKIEESSNLAETVQKKVINYGDQFYDLENRGVRSAPFYVLMGAKMPSILVEAGYVTNPRDRDNLQSYKYLKRLAWGISKAVTAYKKDIQNYASK